MVTILSWAGGRCGTVALATGVTSSLSLLLHHGHVIVVVVPWPCGHCHSHHCCCHCDVAMWPLLSLSWHCGSGHRHHFVVVVTVVWPCHRCHCCCRYGVALSSLSLSVLQWDCDGGGVTVVVSSCCCCCLRPGIGHGSHVIIVVTRLRCGTGHGRHVIVIVIDVAGGAGVGSWMCVGAGHGWVVPDVWVPDMCAGWDECWHEWCWTYHCCPRLVAILMPSSHHLILATVSSLFHC